MFEERLETIRSVCENLKLQTKPALKLKPNIKLSPHANQKHARFQNGVLTVSLLMLKS